MHSVRILLLQRAVKRSPWQFVGRWTTKIPLLTVHWRLKSAAFRLLSRAPLGRTLHYWAQRYILRNFPRSPELLDALWNKASAVVDEMTRHSRVVLREALVIEIGAGRDLSVPLALRFMGVGRVVAIDIHRLAKLDLVAAAARHMAAKARGKPPRLDSWDDLEAFGISYRAPATLDTAGLPPHCADCVCSNEVLEHIEPSAMEAIGKASRRLLKPGGICVHAIDYSDHFARSDPRIDRFNFLTFDDETWRRHYSRLNYLNQLRHSDYTALFEAQGFAVLSERVNPGQPTTTRRAHVAARFQRYSDAELFAINGRIVLGTERSNGAGADAERRSDTRASAPRL